MTPSFPFDLEVAIPLVEAMLGVRIGPWEWEVVKERWHAKVWVDSEATSQYVPATTAWHVLVEDRYPQGLIEFFPDVDAGIKTTFRHQQRNDAVPDRPWRTGKPCLDEVGHLLGRVRGVQEPMDAGRLVWHVERLRSWLRHAAENELSFRGEPLEFPDYQPTDFHFGFQHEPGDAEFWARRHGQWGFAELASTRGLPKQLWLSELGDSRGRRIGAYVWTSLFSDSLVPAVWLAIGGFPVTAPWHAATTWPELATVLRLQGIDLRVVFAGLPFHIVGSQWYLLLGFGVGEKQGDAPDHVHWECIKVPAIEPAPPAHSANGLPIQGARILGRLHAKGSIKWLKATDWNHAQTARRGGLSAWRDACILIIGLGSLGSAVADQMARGGATNLILCDHETFETWNVVRHSLDLRSVGKNKAVEMQAALALRNPRLRIQAIEERFRAAPTEIEVFDRADIVIDCTASDDVIYALGQYNWKRPVRFASLSIDALANHLFLQLQQGAAFSAARFHEAWASRSGGMQKAVSRGPTGCWSPVFPAPWTRITELASRATQALDAHWSGAQAMDETTVFAAMIPGVAP